MRVKVRSSDLIAGLDVGTTKICAVIGEVIGNTVDVKGVAITPSKGLRKGVVVNIDSTVESIRKAVLDIEEMTGLSFQNVRVGISGGHIKGFSSYGAIGIKGSGVSHSDIEKVIDAAKAVYVPLDREVLHVIPTGYAIDGQNGIKDPVGMIGVRLEAEVYIITGSVASIQNLLKCCEKAGIDVDDVIFEPLASAEAVLTDEERELGVSIVDIGGGTTDIILYKDGCLKRVSVIAVGGNHFTNDIAICLRIPIVEAERIKKGFGNAVVMSVDDFEEIEIMQSEQKRTILRRHLAEIIQPRAEELFNLIKKELISCSGYEIATTGVVLTGGGSLLQGIDRLAEAVLGLPVRIGLPWKVRSDQGVTNNPIYSTGVGLLLYGLSDDKHITYYENGFDGIFKKVKDWVKGFVYKK
jgi:cell division protein FtsA